MKKTMVSMILVGGKGTRLKDITKKIAKPAVSFGAKYRLIDFTLSNITNSNIDVCGIVTQYEPFELMYYIGSGASWDLDVLDGGIRFLTPYSSEEDVLWQKGTAHAIKQYSHFVKEYQAKYVLILSGDHIYKMDYMEMLKHHIDHKADITIGATEVDPKEAPRFGILEIDDSDRVIGFEEKPENPKTNLASMGIYIFSSDVLFSMLDDDSDEKLIDFGKDILPKSIKMKKHVSLYNFEGYWRDVGTVESLYAANMDMLDDPDYLGLNISKNLPIYSKSYNLPPHMVKNSGTVKKSVIADGSIIFGEVIHSSIAYQGLISEGAKVHDAVLLPNVSVGKGAFLKNVIVNKDVLIPDNYRCAPEQLVLITEDNLYEVGEIDG